MPRYKIKGETISLKRALTGLGMGIAFSDRADFSGIAEVESLFPGDVMHPAFIRVDEKGTEAAAATAVVFLTGPAPKPPPFSFIADHPFLFYIQDIKTGTMLFVGRIVNPSL
ncbi:MAG: hypothetical protein GF344_01750 [Chitinivibrionales bacterium]|nr:hypothetical protein [Chitinivibrionales bacterium]MBD3355815.1 hypothetical protein [Chitinivibrionales bacterium]